MVWKLPDSNLGHAKAEYWFKKAREEAYFAKGFMINVPHKNAVLVAVSTPESTRAYNAAFSMATPQPIQFPEWFFYDCYWYGGLASLNLAGITQHRFTQHHPERTPKMYELLDHLWAERRVTPDRWRQQYAYMHRGMYMDSFRRMLVDLQVPVWVELCCGRSLWEYMGLDLYAKVFAQGMRPPPEEAWYMLNCRPDVWPINRHEYYPEEWYLICHHLISYGQRFSITESQIVTVNNPYVLHHRIPGDPMNQARMAVWEQELGSGIPNTTKGKGKGKARL